MTSLIFVAHSQLSLLMLPGALGASKPWHQHSGSVSIVWWLMRTREVYTSHCEGLGGPRDHIATTYGVVSNSILNECRYFHITSGLIPDIMHDILEGSLIHP